MLAKRVRNKHFRGTAILSIAGTGFKTEEKEKNLRALAEESCCKEDGQDLLEEEMELERLYLFFRWVKSQIF